jgi:hypothetical protein
MRVMKFLYRPVFLLAANRRGVVVSLLFILLAVATFEPPAASAQSTDSASPATPQAQLSRIPGPLRSFLRLAGISQEVSRDEVMPLLARNAYLLGYSQDTQTEYLRLVNRYLHQARELDILAGSERKIEVSNCVDAGTLLKVLGYRVRNGCGQPNMILETAYPARAFLTIDSGFPLTQLEEALQNGTKFTYAYPASWVPILFSEGDWITLGTHDRRGFGSMLDTITNDRNVARLYWALSKNDSETSYTLQHSVGLQKLLPYAATLDFYGAQIAIRSGRVIVPGGAKSESDWKQLVGASPASPAEFVVDLLAKDRGWLAVYFDTLSRISRSQQEKFTESRRLKTLYEAFRAPDPDVSATYGAFRKAPDLLVLFSRLDWDPSGSLRIPGDLDVWKQIMQQKSDFKAMHDLGVRARSWDHPDQLLGALTAMSRFDTDSSPLQIYLTLSALDSRRPAEMRLSAAMIRQMAAKFSQLSSWYLVFTEFPALGDPAIEEFLKATESIDRISNQPLRANTSGAFQATIGLWQVLARQGQIPPEQLDASWRQIVQRYVNVSTPTQLFDSARASFGDLMVASGGKPGGSQNDLIELLAGPNQDSADGKRVHAEMAGRIRTVLSDQHLVSLETLFALNDGLDDMAHGKPASDRLVSLADELRDFELPRQIFTKSEKTDWAPNVPDSRHTELQSRFDLTKLIRTPQTGARLQAARGQLAPLLRDTLVGLNYAYYEPPGAQILHINPLFVRSHDFTGSTVQGAEKLWQLPSLLGAGVSAGGGGYLMGSLADLSYSLATAEEDLIAPEKIQALMWKELAPELLSDAALTRWWKVTPNELHAVALYQKSGEEILSSSVTNAPLREKAINILTDRMDPQRIRRVEQALHSRQDFATILPRMLPADTFYLGIEFHQRFASEAASAGTAGVQLDEMERLYPTEITWERLSKDFGIPHPTLSMTYARELLNVKPFPFYGGYSSRLFGESWESGNLYWARLADELGYSPVTLNRLVPELTRSMTGKIFATELEDWPAMLRAMHEAGDELRQGKLAALPKTQAALSPAADATSLNGMVSNEYKQ